MASDKVGKVVMDVLVEAYRLGRDFEGHASERFTNPENYDAVCDYVSEETERLHVELMALLTVHTSPAQAPQRPVETHRADRGVSMPVVVG